jgi:tRNA A-37 threonylcarbamoyl transferase component Bud32
MTTPANEPGVCGAPPPMTPERWRAVESILNAALACEPAKRDAFVTGACGDDADLRREVASLLAAHDSSDHAFLERPAAEAIGPLGIAPVPVAERLASTLAGRYAIERELARGGMATVYLARDLKHDRRVAIKVLREEVAAAVGAERFLEEIRVTARLQHPHILPLFDSGAVPATERADDGLLWYVMPFVEGETLRTRLARDGRLPVHVAVQLAREMADALDHAHRQGIVHRDVKPENVLLQGDHALVADFGIALALEHAGGDRLTRTGIAIGTPQYMAPEQASGERAIDARADVYALGAVLHEMLAGQSPFAASSRAAVLWRVKNEPAAALATHRIDVAPFLDAAVGRAMAKRPEDRFSSAAAFGAALTGAPDATEPGAGTLGNGLPDESGPARGQAQRRVVSARAAVYAVIATLVVGIVGGGVLARSLLSGPYIGKGAKPASPPIAANVTWPSTDASNTELVVVDRAGRPQRTIAANRPWTPRISPDGRVVAYGAFGEGRSTSDLWVTDLVKGTTKRLTDDDGDSNDPQWSADGASISYSVGARGGKDLVVQRLKVGDVSVLARRDGTQFASDWLRDGSALLVTEQTDGNKNDILVQPANGSPARPYAATPADESAARASPDGRWVAYTSDESGRSEVYLDSYAKPGHRVTVSQGGGEHPVWRADGRELYYWNDGVLMAVQLDKAWGDAPPAIGAQTILFRAPYDVEPNTMYDASPDGSQFVIVRHVKN